jgi:hypothetical protein
MKPDIILGLPQFISKSRTDTSMNNTTPIHVGDIVAQLKYYRNGKPIKSHKFDYTDSSLSTIGVVVAELYHEYHKTTCIKVRWNNGTKDGIYVKDNATAYLIKLS